MKIELQEVQSIKTKSGNEMLKAIFWIKTGEDLYPTKATGLVDKTYPAGDYEVDFSASVYVSKKNFDSLSLGTLVLREV